MRIIVVWPQGSQLPVRISGSAPVSDLTHLLRFVCQRGNKLAFVHNGVLLDEERTFGEQGIKKEANIHVIIVNSTGLESMRSSLDGVKNEMLRLSDLRNRRKEPEKGVLQGKEESTSDETFEPPMVIAPKPVGIREDPLPSMWKRKV